MVFRFDRGLDLATPAGHPGGVDGHGNEGSPGALGEGGGQHGSRGQFVEKWSPNTTVPSVLIDQDSENSSPFDQVDRSKVAPPAIEGLQAKPPPVAVDQFVEVLVALRLEDSTDRDIPYSSDQLSVKFPIADMIDRHDHALLAVESLAKMGKTDHLDPRLHRLFGHASEAGSAQQIAPKGLKMLPGHPAKFFLCQALAKRHPNIVACQTAVFGQNDPCKEAQRFP